MAGKKTFVAGEVLLAQDVNDLLMDQTIMNFASSAARASAIPTPTEGMTTYLQDTNTLETYNGSNYVNIANAGSASYNLVDTVYFTSSGTFAKGDYPWLRAIKVKTQGAGGGGGGSFAPAAGQGSAGAGGGGGAYSEAFITNIAGLASSVTVTRGAGGGGGAVGGSGATGTTSSFGALVTAAPGAGGAVGGAAQNISAGGGSGGTSGVGDLVILGQTGQHSVINDGFLANRPYGGNGFLGFGSGSTSNLTGSSAGFAGGLYGGGGSGAMSIGAVAGNVGGAGANGVVIVELYA